MTDSQQCITLWGTPHSLYTGKIRSYLIKKGISFRERMPAEPAFQQRVVPVVGAVVVPILELADGTIVQDTSDMIDHLEQAFPARPMLPTSPVQRVTALLLDGFGSEGLLAAAMHYRWSYRAEQEQFLRAEFGRSVHAGNNRDERLAAGAQMMSYFNSFLPFLGVTPQSIPAHEAAYEELLDALDIHFLSHPYLLGGHPSIADFGFMAPLFAHLGRDPYPSALMKNRAPNVFRWTERMNLAGIGDVEFPDRAEAWLPDDALPATLEPVLALLFKDWGTLLAADAGAFNAWSQGLPAGTPTHIAQERKIHPTVGMVEYQWRGCKIQRASAPHGLWLFAKAQAAANGLSGAAQQRVAELLKRTGGEPVMALQLARQMKRENYNLVLQ